jgi:PAS domain S-box-containing protein
MNLAYDLFLLTFNLSQLHSRDKIIQLFIEGLQEIFKPSVFVFSETSEENENDTFEMKTGYKHYGYILSDIKGSLENEHIVLLRNSTQMVAVIIDNLDYNDRIEKEKNQLQEFADLKLIELKHIVKDLEDSRSASINLIEDLNIEIEKRKDAERAISKTEKYFRFLIEKAPDGIALIGIDGKMIYASPSAYKIFGYSLNKEVLPDPNESTHPDDLPYVLSTLNELSKDPSLVLTIEYRFKKKDGTWKWIESTFSNHLEEEGINAIVINFRDISDRKKAEKELRESEQKFRNLFEHSPVGKSMTNVDGTLNVNKSFCRILGYSESELKAKNWKEISHPSDIKNTDAIVKSLVEGKAESAGFEKRYLHKDGRTIYADVATFLQRDDTGNPEFFITTINDITERRNLERERFRLLDIIDKSLNEIYVFDSDTLKFEYVNKGALKNLGYTIEEMRILTPVDIKPLISETTFRNMVKPLLSAKTEVLVFETVHIRKNGTEYPVEVYLQLYREEGNKLLFAVINDITNRRKTEETLRSNYALLTAAGRVAKFGGWNVILAENRSYWSDEVAAIHEMPAGYSPPVSDGINFYAPEFKDKITSVFTECAKNGVSYDEEMQIITSSGKRRWIRTIGEAVRDKAGRIYKVQGFFQDISEQKKSEEEIRKLNDELEERVMERTAQLNASNKELEAFSYSVSHDLRAPLRAIHSFTGILKEDYKDALDDEGKRICGIIETSSVHMGQLIDDLLSFSRIGRTGLQFIKIDMTKAVKTVFNELPGAEEKKKISFKVEKLPAASGDSATIKQVLINLISNAIKYTSKNDTPEIVVGFEKSCKPPAYYVKDNGVGFDMLYVNKLFGVFQRLHSSKEFEGNGVGLAIVHRIIQRHGGKVWAEGEVGKGATFYFTLPYRPQDRTTSRQ